MAAWPPHVLLTSNKDLTRKLLRDSVRRLGVEVFELLRSSNEALLTLQKEKDRWQILILDSGTPRALETVKKIREANGKEPKILFLLSESTRETILEASKAGVNGFVTTPFSPDTLEKKMRAALGITPPPANESDAFRIRM